MARSSKALFLVLYSSIILVAFALTLAYLVGQLVVLTRNDASLCPYIKIAQPVVLGCVQLTMLRIPCHHTRPEGITAAIIITYPAVLALSLATSVFVFFFEVVGPASEEARAPMTQLFIILVFVWIAMASWSTQAWMLRCYSVLKRAEQGNPAVQIEKELIKDGGDKVVDSGCTVSCGLNSHASTSFSFRNLEHRLTMD